MHTQIKTRPSWDEYFISMLPIIKLRASCPRRQGGALIVDGINRLISTGYNGPPSKLPNCTDVPCPGVNQESGTTTKCIALHAEHNAIHFAGDRIDLAEIMYCTTEPCMKCALEILQTPIKKVIFLEDYPSGSRALLNNAGVACYKYWII